MRYRQFAGTVGFAALALVVFGADRALAHCDGLDGPVVKAAQQALKTGDVNRILIWVQKENEAELASVFRQTLVVRQLGSESRALADRHLFETLVRLHRDGEGAPYSGLKPAGRDLGPAIPAADQAVESGDITELEALLAKELRRGLRESYAHVRATRSYDPKDLTAGRAHVKAYVEYMHFVERIHDAVTHSAPGHFAEPATH